MIRSGKRGLALLVSLTLLILGGTVFASAAQARPRTATPLTAAVTGTHVDATTGAVLGTVAGTFDVQKFVAQNGTLQAVGSLSATITDATGAVTSGTQQVSLPVDLAQATGSCQILDLVLGPLDLNLLGLVVHLDTVHLNITAQQGPGNLLGNLLCAVAGLLNGPTGLNAILTQIAALLNQLLGNL